MTITDAQKLDLLRHTIGWGRESNRNHFVAGEGSANCDICRALVNEGRMVEYAPSDLTGGDPLFLATPAGREWTAANAPPAPKLTPGQRRYRDYLKSDSNLAFGDWLKAHAAPKRRASAGATA